MSENFTTLDKTRVFKFSCTYILSVFIEFQNLISNENYWTRLIFTRPMIVVLTVNHNFRTVVNLLQRN